MGVVPLDPLLVERLRRQRLAGERCADPVEAIAWFGGVQAQDFAGALWAVGQRCESAVQAELLQLFDAGAFLRTHVMRPTWHLVAPADLRWMLALTSPRVHTTNGPYYRKEGLEHPELHRAADVITGALQGAQLTRKELGEALAHAGIATDGLRLTLMVMWCELEGLICSGAMRGKQHTLALLDERVPPTPPKDRDEALGELATRYFRSHGPARDVDFAWWSGLRLADARRAIDISGVLRYPGSEPSATGGEVHLLPNFDEYVVAYKDRTALVPQGVDATVRLESNLVVVNGLVSGTWKRTLRADAVAISFPTIPAHKSPNKRLIAASRRFGEFIGLPVEFDVRTTV